MKIEAIDLYEVQATLRHPFETSFGRRQQLRKMLVVIHSEGVEGYGECTAHDEPGYSYETVDTAWYVLEQHAIPKIIGQNVATPAELLQRLSAIRGHNMAVAALESAFWDAQAKQAKLPLWQFLGGIKRPIAVGASIGIQKSIEATVEQARSHHAQGYKRLKFKIKPQWDVAPMRAVREALPEAALTVDANSAYRLTDAHIFQALDELALDYIEQPLAHDDLIDHQQLQRQLKTPICLDESIHSAEDARKGLQLEAGRIINIKMGRCRGHLAARRVHDVADSFGAPVWCGGMHELGIGRAHNLHLSTLRNFSLAGDTASASRYWQEDIIDRWLEAEEGWQHVPDNGAGIGVSINWTALKKIQQRHNQYMP